MPSLTRSLQTGRGGRLRGILLHALAAYLTAAGGLHIAVPTAHAAGDTPSVAGGPVRWTQTASPARVRAYWTPARIRRAELATAVTLEPAATAATLPGGGWRSFPATAVPVSWDNTGVRVTGRLYATRPDGSLFACSASVVRSGNRSVVLTAGHCVHGGRGSNGYTNLAFVPGFRPGATPAGEAPYGIWPAQWAASTRAWARAGDRFHIRRDLAAIVLGRDPAGRTITDALGGAHRIRYGFRGGRRVSLLGYPASGRWATNLALWTCPRRGVGRYRLSGGTGPNPLAVMCEMTPGASGGPWLTRVDGDGLGELVSVTSAMDAGAIYGPALDRAAPRLVRRAGHVAV